MIVDFKDKSDLVSITHEYPLVHHFSGARWEVNSNHIEMAKWINEHKGHLSAYMFIVEVEYLAEEHIEDPRYLQRTYSIGASEAVFEARQELINRFFSSEELEALIKEHEFSLVKYNYKEQPKEERAFKHEVHDAFFRYQETKEMVKFIIHRLENAKYKLDEYGHPIEDDEGDFILEGDSNIIKVNREKLLERFLVPKMLTEYQRVYNMPEPFNHWDSRSFWHQFFFLENHDTEEIMGGRGQGGGSGSRESNGRWAHTFAQLTKEYDFKIPTWHLIYDRHNELRCHTCYDTFKSLSYDLTGNYDYDHKESRKLFEGLLIDAKRV